MHSFRCAVVIGVFLLTLLVGNALAVGVSSVGREECACPELVAAGVIPDTLNRVTRIVQFLNPASVVDRISGEIKAILGQFGVETIHRTERLRIKPVARFAEKKTRKTRKWRRVKLPPVRM
ncbi:MAG: hypothetical protein P8182_16440 [Deltaproteobacteria bacterium]